MNQKQSRIEKPIIFIGSGRTGTTIISEIIMRHPDLAFPSNYQKFFKSHLINLIRCVFDNKIWRNFGQKKQLNKVKFLNKYIFKPDEAYLMWSYLSSENINFSRDFLYQKKETTERVIFIHNYFDKMVKYQNRKRLSIKITGPSRISYLMSIFPDAYFINLKRKKLPVINSFLKVDFWKSRGYNKLWWQGVYSKEEIEWANKNAMNPLLITTLQLKKIDGITELEIIENKPKYIEINYEDFVKNPKSEIQKILIFADLMDNSKDCFSYLEKIKIYDRNNSDIENFTQNEITKINEILQNQLFFKNEK